MTTKGPANERLQRFRSLRVAKRTEQSPSLRGSASASVLPFISSAFVPTDSMPGAVRAFAENQPVTTVVNAIRDLLTQQPVGTDIWIALAWLVGVLIVAYTFAMATYRRKIS
jgi:ABC-type multidrug transport system permease subunit